MTREEALSKVKGYLTDYIPSDNYEEVEEIIKALEQERWIPTSERLPEEDGEYYATVYDTDENYKYMDIAELEDGIWQYKDYVKVLSWMPLPKLYEPQESEVEDGNDD